MLVVRSQSQPIWTSDYECTGSEENLDMCRRSAVVGYSNDCSYRDTSGAECSGISIGLSYHMHSDSCRYVSDSLLVYQVTC